jgi:Clostripain family
MPYPKKWGIYVYFAADVPQRQMQIGAWRNLQALASAGSSDTVGITVMMDLPCRDTEYYLIPKKPAGMDRWSILPDRFVPNVDSASVETITDFFQWSHLNCPAERVALIFWGHGYALDDYDPRVEENGGQGSVDSDSDDKGRSYKRSARSFPGKRGQELKLLYDATHNSVLNNRDFANVLDGYNTSYCGGKKVHVLGLDCCNMAMAEVMCQLQDYAEFAIAAETGLPFQSWLSASILKKFIGTPHVSAEQFAKDAVDDFIGSFARSTDAYVALSACDLGKFKDVEEGVKELASALYIAIDEPQNRAFISKAWFNDVSFLLDGMIDLSSFCGFLQQYMPKTPTADAAKAVQMAVERFVIKRGIAPNLPGRKISLSRGLSIWFPSWIQFPAVDYLQIAQSKDYLIHGYPQTRFAQTTGWNKFLLKLLQLTQSR